MKPVKRRRVDEQVYEQLLLEIRENVWQPGEKLPSEAQLCDVFGVSRVTVRSAIQRLKALGLVDILHGKGTFVVDPSEVNLHINNQEIDLTEKEFNDITEVRATLEPSAAELFIKHGTDEDFERFRQIHEDLKTARENRSYEDYTRNDFLFHYTIILSTHNDLMVQMATVVKDQYYRYFSELNKFLLIDESQPDLADFSNMNDCHEELYNAIRQRKAEAATKITELILTSNQDCYQYYLQVKRDGSKTTKYV